jgi:hypothetical protein
MDLEILKKKISTYRTEGGHIKIKDDGLLLELLSAWEQWTGPASGFSSALGVHRKAIPGLIGKAKRLRREGFPSGDFKEIKVEGGNVALMGPNTGPCLGIELGLPDGKLIRFPSVDPLLEFLKKAA